MNATELTTSEWLSSQGYCVMSSVKFGGREADLLAMRPTDGSRPPVEVSVSPRPSGSRRAIEAYEAECRAQLCQERHCSAHWPNWGSP
jgi:hypothetical protein